MVGAHMKLSLNKGLHNSIIAGKLARELHTAMEKQPNGIASALYEAGSYDLWLHGRFTKSRNVELWGDLTFKPALKHTSKPVRISKRLRGDKYIYRHAADIAERLRQSISLLQRREALSNRVE